jgi:hypothetical protein
MHSTDYASLFRRLSRRSAVLSVNVINWVKLAMTMFHTPWRRISSEAALFSASQELQWRCCVFLIRRLRRIANSDYGVRHVCVCLSVRMEQLRCD